MTLVLGILSPNPKNSPRSKVRITKNFSSSFWYCVNDLLVLLLLPDTILNFCCPYGGFSFMMCILLTTLHWPFIIPYTVPLWDSMSFKITYDHHLRNKSAKSISWFFSRSRDPGTSMYKLFFFNQYWFVYKFYLLVFYTVN